MPNWILLLGLPTLLAYALWKQYGDQQPGTFTTDPATGQVIAFDSSTPTLYQQVMTLVSNLYPSQGALDFIRNTETFMPSAYKDARGYSIGFGHKIEPGEPYNSPLNPTGSVYTISRDEAEQIFEADVDKAAQCIRDHCQAVLSQGQFDALTDFVFNVGCPAFITSTMLALLNRNDYAGASQQFTRWVYAHNAAGQPYVVGDLVTRRLQEQATFNA